MTGFKRTAQMIYDWHKTGVMSKELWGSVSGTAYRGANEEFKNAQVPFYLSGSWQIGQFDKTVGNAFDWIAVPTPCGPANCSRHAGWRGAGRDQDHQEPGGCRARDGLSRQRGNSVGVLRPHAVRARPCRHRQEGRRLPGCLAAGGRRAQGVRQSGCQRSMPAAYRIQGYTYSRIVFNAAISRLGQAIAGEGTLDEAYKRIEADVAQQIAERNKK